MNSTDQARLLFGKAEEDIHLLRTLRDNREIADAIWGFHAQQAVEKLIKSLLAYHKIRFPFSHRLLELAELLSDANRCLDQKFEPLLDLTP